MLSVVVSTDDFTYQAGTVFSSTVYVISLPFESYFGKSYDCVQVSPVPPKVFSMSFSPPLNTIVIGVVGRGPFSPSTGALLLSSHTFVTVTFLVNAV